MRPRNKPAAICRWMPTLLGSLVCLHGCAGGSRSGDGGGATSPNSLEGGGGSGGGSGQNPNDGLPVGTNPNIAANPNVAANPNAASSSPLPAQTTQTIGRFVTAAAGQTFALTGSTMMATFTGTGIGLTLDELTKPTQWPGDPSDAAGNLTTQGNRYAVTVDGTTTLLTPTAGAGTYTLAQNLPAGSHTVKVVKLTEARVGSATFGGFTVVGGQLVPVSRTVQRRLEVIGDSISAGYGNLGNSSACSFSPGTQDGQATYGMLAAAAVSADVHVVAYSGKGVLRNNFSAKDAIGNMTMAQLWTFALPDDPQAAWDTASWQPNAVVINLGTNDFYQDEPPQAAFEAAFLAMVKQVRAAYPQAVILLAVGPMLSNFVASQPNQLTHATTFIQDVVTSSADAKVHFLELSLPNDSYLQGCDGHPTAAGQALMAKQLQAALNQYLGW